MQFKSSPPPNTIKRLSTMIFALSCSSNHALSNSCLIKSFSLSTLLSLFLLKLLISKLTKRFCRFGFYALKNQKHNIPAEYVGVQTLIKQHFPELAGENKLPFLGELIKVKEEFKTTHGLIIEAVLRELNLPCALLLPKSLEQAVLTFLTEQATKKKLPNVRLLVVEDSIEVNDIDCSILCEYL